MGAIHFLDGEIQVKKKVPMKEAWQVISSWY